MSDADGYRAAREARAGVAERVTHPTRTGTDAIRMVDAAVYRYEHQVRGHHHLPPPESTEDKAKRR